MTRRAETFAALLLLFPLTAFADDRPDWVSGASKDYPAGAYIIGVGEAATQAKAADRARAEVSKSLSLSVEQKTHAYAGETTDGKSSSFSQEVSDDVRTSTNKVLDGVTVAQYWQGPDGVYALAVLDRGHSLKIIKDKLDEIDRDFATGVAQLDKLDGKFARLRVALRLVKIGRDRRRLNADYRILNPEGKGLPPPGDEADVLAAARKAVAKITVQVAATGQQAEKVQARLIDGLTAHGLRAVEKSDRAADIVIDASAEAQGLPPENITWYWAKGSIVVRLSYGSTGETFTRFEESLQQASGDPGSAIDVTLKQLGDVAADHAFKTITTGELLDD